MRSFLSFIASIVFFSSIYGYWNEQPNIAYFMAMAAYLQLVALKYS